MEKPTYSYKDVADFFIAFANSHGDPITNLKLQKLVYYAQAWYLANYHKPLFMDAEFQAWVHGPVILELYRQYKNGVKPIEKDIKLDAVKETFLAEDFKFLEEVAEVYMPESAYALELMTHIEDPWKEARNGIAADQSSEAVISITSMEKFYARRIADR